MVFQACIDGRAKAQAALLLVAKAQAALLGRAAKAQAALISVAKAQVALLGRAAKAKATVIKGGSFSLRDVSEEKLSAAQTIVQNFQQAKGVGDGVKHVTGPELAVMELFTAQSSAGYGKVARTTLLDCRDISALTRHAKGGALSQHETEDQRDPAPGDGDRWNDRTVHLHVGISGGGAIVVIVHAQLETSAAFRRV